MSSKKLIYIIIAIGLILFNAIAFITPLEKTTSFWICYSFTTIAFLVQIYSWHTLIDDKILKSKFLKIPNIYISSIYLLLQLILFALYAIFKFQIVWVIALLCISILSISIIAMLLNKLGENEINTVEEKISRDTKFIKTMQVNLELIQMEEENKEIKKELEKLIETIKYSDPTSNESLTEIDKEITNKISELKKSKDKSKIIVEINSLILERNKKNKINK